MRIRTRLLRLEPLQPDTAEEWRIAYGGGAGGTERESKRETEITITDCLFSVIKPSESRHGRVPQVPGACLQETNSFRGRRATDGFCAADLTITFATD